jgi:hypothetical protein
VLPASPELEGTRATLAAVLAAIPVATGSRVVVDSSKGPGFGTLLEGIPGVELSVVHLVRDPRAVAHSRLKVRERRGYELRPGPPGFALVWDLWNATIELLWSRKRYLRVGYEDFVRRPEQVARQVAELVGEPATGLRLAEPDTVELAPTHSVAGNRNRFQTGPVTLRLDDEWLTAERYRTADRRAVAALSWPLRARYGYGGPGG